MSPLPPPLPPTAGRSSAAFDGVQLQRFLSYIMRPGECYEVAALHAAHLSASEIGPALRAMTLAGWYDSPQAVIADAQKLKGVCGFLIPNPAEYDLIARTHNRLHKQAARTKDDEITVIRWAFLDIDWANRKKDTSGTDAELAETIATRDTILAHHPEIRAASIYGRSGNGCWVLVRLPDYPNDPEHRALLARFIAEMGRRFDGNGVEVDQHSKNPARLMCLVGTQKCKGENSTATGRVWRLSTIDSPEGHDPAPLDLAGWLEVNEPPAAPPAPRATVAIQTPVGGERERRIARAAAYVANIAPAVSGQGGHDQTFDAACALVKGFDLTVGEARPILAAWNLACVPPWADHELEHKLADADARPDDKPRGYLFDVDNGWQGGTAGANGDGAAHWGGKALLAAVLAAGGFHGHANGNGNGNGHQNGNGHANGHHGAGNGHAHANGLPLPPPLPPPIVGGPRPDHAGGAQADAGPGLVADDDPHRLARAFLDENYGSPAGPTLRFWQEQWYGWRADSGCYVRRPTAEIRAELVGWMHHEYMRLFEAALMRWAMSKGKGGAGGGGEGGEEKAKRPTCKPVTVGAVANVLQALTSFAVLPVRDVAESPAWVGPHPWHPTEIIPARNALIHLPSLEAGKPATLDPTPAFFSTYATTFDYDPDAPEPAQWLAFLNQLWPDDPESIATLQEWFGYSLTPDTRQQKILALIGPRRCGKGTIARVLRGLVGAANVEGPTLSGLGTDFGLAPLVGKPLAIIDDARLSSRTDQAVITERLLTISGEGTITVDRKYLSHWTGKLPTRLVIISNELPALADASAALVGRILLLQFNHSFYGKEDETLTARLLTELPGILRWAIEGWRRLQARRRFVQPRTGRETLGALEQISSPILDFINERCRVGLMEEVPTADMYNAWRTWCQAQGNDHPGNEVHFGRKLRAAVAGITKRRHRQDGGFVAYYAGVRLLHAWEAPADMDDPDAADAPEPRADDPEAPPCPF